MVDERIPKGLQTSLLLLISKMAETMETQPKMQDQISFIQLSRVLQHQMREMPVSKYIRDAFRTLPVAKKPPGKEHGPKRGRKAG